MSNCIKTKIGAVAFAVVLGCMVFPSCVIRIGPGSGDDEPAVTGGDPAGGTGKTGATGGQGGAGGIVPSPDEVQAAIDAFDVLKNADPQQVAVKSAAAAYSSVTTASLVESQITDPMFVDPAMISQLFEQYAPLAADETLF